MKLQGNNFLHLPLFQAAGAVPDEVKISLDLGGKHPTELNGSWDLKGIKPSLYNCTFIKVISNAGTFKFNPIKIILVNNHFRFHGLFAWESLQEIIPTSEMLGVDLRLQSIEVMSGIYQPIYRNVPLLVSHYNELRDRSRILWSSINTGNVIQTEKNIESIIALPESERSDNDNFDLRAWETWLHFLRTEDAEKLQAAMLVTY